MYVVSLNNIIQERFFVCCFQGEHGQEALLLLCKAHFILGDFQNVVKCCNEAQADDLAVDLMSKRKAKMVADALAYKGTCT